MLRKSSAMPEPNGSGKSCCSREEQRRLRPRRGLVKKRIFGSIAKFFKRNRRQKEEEDANGDGNNSKDCNQ